MNNNINLKQLIIGVLLSRVNNVVDPIYTYLVNNPYILKVLIYWALVVIIFLIAKYLVIWNSKKLG